MVTTWDIKCKLDCFSDDVASTGNIIECDQKHNPSYYIGKSKHCNADENRKQKPDGSDYFRLNKWIDEKKLSGGSDHLPGKEIRLSSKDEENTYTSEENMTAKVLKEYEYAQYKFDCMIELTN